MDLAADMTFQRRNDRDSQQSYLLNRQFDGKPNDRVIEKVIESLMLQPLRGR